jgi:hypothetical protein
MPRPDLPLRGEGDYFAFEFGGHGGFNVNALYRAAHLPRKKSKSA